MKKLNEMTLKDYFNIPNLLGYFRILLLPVFLYLYTHAKTKQDFAAAFFVLALSIMTDFFDGKIARRFDMVTDFGKILDPIADKLTQGVLALALLSHYPRMLWFFISFLCKELYMAFMGFFLIQKGKGINGAQMCGKVCTTLINFGIFILFLFPKLPETAGNLIIDVLIVTCIITILQYFKFHRSLLKKETAA